MSKATLDQCPSLTLRRCDSKYHIPTETSGPNPANMLDKHRQEMMTKEQHNIDYNVQEDRLASTPVPHGYSLYETGMNDALSMQQAYTSSQVHQPMVQWPHSYHGHPPLPQAYHEPPPPPRPQQQQQQWMSTFSADFGLQNQPYPQQSIAAPFPPFTDPVEFQQFQEMTTVGSSQAMPPRYLSPIPASFNRSSRSESDANSASRSIIRNEDIPPTDSRSSSPNATEMLRYGVLNHVDGTWSCAWPSCASHATFTRGCDLRKHYKRHAKTLYCSHTGCPQANVDGNGGFSSKKDLARHEASHNPQIHCAWSGCPKMFSRQDNMRDHVRRVHKARN